MKSSEDSVCDDASSDQHPVVTTGECNDDPGGGLANHNICENVEANQDASQPAGQLACEEEFEKELNQEVPPDVDKDATKESLEDLPDMQNPKVGILTSKDDLRDTIENQEVPDKLDEAKSDVDKKDIKNCYDLENFGILDCIEISEDSPEEIIGGEKSIGRSTLCSLQPDVAKVPPLYYDAKRRSC
jgi:hypothetical protein